MTRISEVYNDIDMKAFSTNMLINYPCILPSVEAVDLAMKQYAHKLSGNDRVAFEENCLERVAELLLEEKGEL